MQQTHEYMSVAVKYNPSLTPNETSLRNPEVAPVESDPRRGQARPPESSGNRGAVNTQASAICSSISEQTNTAGGKQKEGQKRTHQEPTASPHRRASKQKQPQPQPQPAAACLGLGRSAQQIADGAAEQVALPCE